MSTAEQIAEMEKKNKKKKVVKKNVPETVPEVDLEEVESVETVLVPVQAIVNKLYKESDEIKAELELLGVVSAPASAPEASAAPTLSEKKREKAVRIWQGFAGDKLAEMASSASQRHPSTHTHTHTHNTHTHTALRQHASPRAMHCALTH